MITKSNYMVKNFYRRIFSMFFNSLSKSKSSYEKEFDEAENNEVEYNIFLSQVVVMCSLILLVFTFIPFLVVFFILHYLGLSFLGWFLPWAVIWSLTCMIGIGLFKSENAKRFKKKAEENSSTKRLPISVLYRMNDLDLVIATVIGIAISFFSNI